MLNVDQSYGAGKQYMRKNDFEMGLLFRGFTVGN